MPPTVNDLVGRRDAAHGCANTEEVIGQARHVFADVSAMLRSETEKLFETEVDDLDEKRITRIADLIRQTQKALMMVLEIEAKLGHDTDHSRRQMLDLTDAKAEIARRLARLAKRG